jgi:hypothetical protein
MQSRSACGTSWVNRSSDGTATQTNTMTSTAIVGRLLPPVVGPIASTIAAPDAAQRQVFERPECNHVQSYVNNERRSPAGGALLAKRFRRASDACSASLRTSNTDLNDDVVLLSCVRKLSTTRLEWLTLWRDDAALPDSPCSSWSSWFYTMQVHESWDGRGLTDRTMQEEWMWDDCLC